jgi:hypothetical protein
METYNYTIKELSKKGGEQNAFQYGMEAFIEGDVF